MTRPLPTYADDATALLTTLRGHNAWATSVLIDRARALTEEQFHQKFDIGPGSVHDTLRHIIAAMLRWTDRILDRALKPSIDAPEKRYTPEQLADLLGRADAELGGALDDLRRAGRLREPMQFEFDGRNYDFLRATAILHVLTHGVHHRAQILNMFRQLGLPPLGLDLDAVEWECVQTGQIKG